MNLTLRPAQPADRARIVEISAQVWEGSDYIPTVVDTWLVDPNGVLLVAVLEDQVVGFAHLSWLFPTYAWLEGIRTDPAHRNRGIAKAITRALIDLARAGGAKSIGLSTHITNDASIHVIESFGFFRAASFVALEADGNSPVWAHARPSQRVRPVSLTSAAAFLQTSSALAVARGYLPTGWEFHPFALGPAVVLARMRHIIGIVEDGGLRALLCAGQLTAGHDEFTINFLDGEPQAISELLRHALHLAGETSYVAAMVPRSGGEIAPALEELRKVGFVAWNDFEEDVFIYRQDVASPAPGRAG